MGRPRGLNIAKLHEYDKLHTKKTKMYCGVEQTTLYLIKETPNFYMSNEVWAYCASKFKSKKNIELSVDIPILRDQKVIDFLEENAWHDWVKKERGDKESDLPETRNFFDKIFPEKEMVYFYELESLIGAYNQGTLISYDDNGNIEPISENCLKNQKYYNHKYNRFPDSEEVVKYRERWTSEKDEVLRKKYLSEYHDFETEWAFKNNNLINTFIEIGKHSVCFPVGFNRGTADWHIEKYGTVCSYAHVGEIFFVATEDKIFFEIKRHF